MKISTIWLALCGCVLAARLFSADSGDDSKPIRQSEDPSYEPMRDAGTPKKTKKPEKDPAQQPTKVVVPPVQVEVAVPTGPRVKYILDGKPVYDGEIPVDGRATADAKKNDAPKKTSKRASKDVVVDDPAVFAPANPAVPIETVPSSGPRVKYILDGKPVYEGDLPSVSATVRVPSQPDGTYVPQTAPIVRPAPAAEIDLTADQPGTKATALQDLSVLPEMLPPPGEISSRAKKCYALLADIKANIETVSRCLDNRGKENAKLIHTADEVSKNISDMATIWPKNEECYDKCAAVKRCALLLNDELSETPWKWAQVRWSFDALLKESRGFREYCKILADAERKPQILLDPKGHPVLDKSGKPTYIDVPDVAIDPLTARREAQARADREENERIKRRQKSEEDAKNDEHLRTTLDK